MARRGRVVSVQHHNYETHFWIEFCTLPDHFPKGFENVSFLLGLFTVVWNCVCVEGVYVAALNAAILFALDHLFICAAVYLCCHFACCLYATSVVLITVVIYLL